MKKSFRLVVRTPEKEVVNREVHSVTLNTEEGRMTVLPGHAALSGSILFSRLEVKGEGFEDDYLVRRGLLFVNLASSQTTIMAYSCDKTDEVKIETVREYMAFLEEQLKKGPTSLSSFQLKYLEGEKLAVSKHLEAAK